MAIKVQLGQLERVASGTHYAQELLRLPLETAKGCQCTIHNMRLQNMIVLVYAGTCWYIHIYTCIYQHVQCFQTLYCLLVDTTWYKVVQ